MGEACNMHGKYKLCRLFEHNSKTSIQRKNGTTLLSRVLSEFLHIKYCLMWCLFRFVGSIYIIFKCLPM